MWSRRGKSAQAGVSTVEFTVALPLVLFLLLGVSELGRAFLQYNMLTRAVRDSARWAASNAIRGSTGVVNLDGPTIASARNLVVYGNTGGTGVTLLPGLSPANVTVTDLGGGNVSVSAAYNYQPMIGSAVPNLVGSGNVPTTFTLKAEIVMRAIS